MQILDLGLIDYKEALKIQEDLLRKRSEGAIDDTLLLLEHKQVVTFGRIADHSNILSRQYFDSKGFDVLETSRGGRLTCHMPGQLVVYPIIDLAGIKKDVSFYIDGLEEAIASALSSVGVPAGRDPEHRGVWGGGKKIAFIGVKVTKWITWHGAAININNDVEPFSKINPCGEAEIKVTSAKDILGRELDIKTVKDAFARSFEEVFIPGREACACS